MSAEKAGLPKELKALVHHVELNRAGWFDKTINRLVLAALWLTDRPLSHDDIRHTVKEAFRYPLSSGKLELALQQLQSQNTIVVHPGNRFQIPHQQRQLLDKEIQDAERIENGAKELFLKLAHDRCPALPAESVWGPFESKLLMPLVKAAGANMHALISGSRMTVETQHIAKLLAHFPQEHHDGLKELISQFLDPSHSVIRDYVSRLLHAEFCVEAVGLPDAVIQKLNSTVGSKTHFRIFVDTNFLFSILGIHENPSNAAAAELKDLTSHLKDKPKVEFFVTPRTVDEARRSIGAVKAFILSIPAIQSFTQAAIEVGVSGLARRFFDERLRLGGTLNIDDWFGPYLNDFISVARGRGVELYNEPTPAYASRQDVVDDINDVLAYEESHPKPGRQKSYDKVQHDVILWHLVNDRRPRNIESPLDASEWILTIDYRFIAFDRHKQYSNGGRVPLCLDPTSLMQLLQFWVPRSQEFEEAMLGSLRLPILFQEFDVDAERTSLKILCGLGRFDGREEFSEQTITRVILNEGLRSRLRADHTTEEEVKLIKDALVEESTRRAKQEEERATELRRALEEKVNALRSADADRAASEGVLAELKSRLEELERGAQNANETIANQAAAIAESEERERRVLLAREHRRDCYYYLVLLLLIGATSCIAAWKVPTLAPHITDVLGVEITRTAAGVTVFLLGHLVVELLPWGRARIERLWALAQVRRFRKWLWASVLFAFVVGIIVNLYSHSIQKRLDEQQDVGRPIIQAPTPPSL